MEGHALHAGLRRHRRLLGLCALSALVHLALLEWFAAGTAGSPPAPPPGAPGDEMVLRLVMPAAVAPAAVAPRSTTPPDVQPPPAPATAPAPPRPAPTPAPRPAPAPDIPLDTPLDDAPPQTAPKAAAAPPGSAAPDSPPDAAPLRQMPSRYRVRMPGAVRLRYVQTRQAGAGAPERLPDARLEWRSDGERYELEVDGVLGRLASRGTSSDTGVRPRSAVEEAGNGALATGFGDGQVRFGATGTSAPDTLGIQDRASVLMQLAGMGLAEPDQMQGTIEIAVAGSSDARIEQYQVIGMEQLATPIGTLRAWHLAQRAVPGRHRLEIWLAPDKGWLPVQLRLTGADGIAATQVVSAIETPAPAQPAG